MADKKPTIYISPANLGEIIKELRTEQQIKQADLAAKCEINEVTLRRIENNYGHSPAFDIVFRIFNALGYQVAIK